MSKDYTDLFELVKSLDLNLKDFMSHHYGFEWKGRGSPMTACPFHGDDMKSPNLSYKKTKNFVKCFVCEEGGDLIKFVEKYKKISPLQACMEILDLEKISYVKPYDTQELSEDEKKKRDEQNKKIKEENLKKQKNKELEEKELQRKAVTYCTNLANKLELDYIEHAPILEKLFANRSSTLLDWLDLYLAYDPAQDSIAILNRQNDKKKTCHNIKHQLKYTWDNKAQDWSNQRVMNGDKPAKWVSKSNAPTFPFPYSAYCENKSDTVFITEGEKDALNLLSYGIKVLTLGGVSTPWEEYKNFLKDKTVYIWFDNDSAGYKGAIKRYKEIKEVAKEVLIVLFFQINGGYDKGYDITDYLFEKNFKSKEDILHSIAYSSVRLSTTTIKKIEDYLDEDLSAEYFNESVKTFAEIKKQWLKKSVHGEPEIITRAKGQQEIKELEDFYKAFKDRKRETNFEDEKNEILQGVLPKFAEDKKVEIDNLITMFDTMFTNYSKLEKHYRQTHLSDIVTSIEQMTKRTDNTFAKYNGNLCVWLGTHYHVLDELIDDFPRFILRGYMPLAHVDKKKQTSANVKTILDDIYMGAPSLNEIKERQKEKRVINFLNGTFILSQSGKYVFKGIHNKDDGATNILEFEYNKDATATKWKKFLNRVIPNKKTQKTLMQFIGYCFLPNHNYEAFLLLYGKSGANGKSVIQDVIRMFFGEENVSSLQLHEFEGHQLHALNNKILNIGSEIDTKGLVKGQMSTLKALVSPRDTLTINPKNKDAYTLKPENKPKAIFSTNELPRNNVDKAVFRRTLIINFDAEIKDDEKIRDLSSRFSDEMAGVFNMALDALQDLIKDGKFTKSEEMDEFLEEYKDDVTPLRKYIKENLEIDEEVMIPKKYLYAHYVEYSNEKGKHPLGSDKFFKALNEEMKRKFDTAQLALDTEDILPKKPWMIKGLYCKADHVQSFEFGKKSISTNTINRSIESKEVLLDEK